MMRVALGIESSCDETAAAVVREDGTILSSLIYSQIEIHKPFGGVVPEVAARNHLEKIDELVKQALQQAQMSGDQLDLIVSTAGPGLIGGLMVGVTYGRFFAAGLKKPWYGVNHLEGHALTARLTDRVSYPYILLLVSGGHSQVLWVEGLGQYKRLGTTLDDAAGECFDKSAKILGLGYPGGPAIENAAQTGDAQRFKFPHPLVGQKNCNFSFSGLKTAVRQQVLAMMNQNMQFGHTEHNENTALSLQDRADVAASLQSAIAAVMVDRTRQALQEYATHASALVVAGGVAANTLIRTALTKLAGEYSLPLIAPPLRLCGDNAAMIAWAGLERFISGHGPEDDGAPRPRWPLDPTAKLPSGLSERYAK